MTNLVTSGSMLTNLPRRSGSRHLSGALAGVLDPGEGVAASLVVALHLDERRPLLASFLDSVGLPHKNGILEEEGPPEPLAEAVARQGVQSLLKQFPPSQVWTYLNALWLQDPDRWQVLERLSEE